MRRPHLTSVGSPVGTRAGLRETPARLVVRCPRSVIPAGRVPRSATAAATRWSRRSGGSSRTSRRSASTTAAPPGACTCARVASRRARSPRPSRSRRSPGGRLRSVPAHNLDRFRTVVEAALAQLEERRQEVNDLNVFPVADGDTGDNMALTLRAVVAELDRLTGEDRGRTIDEIGREDIVESVARAALLGARGNSGVILSQLIRGAAEELASRPGELVDPVLVGAAMARAADRAYASVRDPAEGTILTVVREMAHRIASDLAHMPDTRLGPDAPPEVQDAALAEIMEGA